LAESAIGRRSFNEYSRLFLQTFLLVIIVRVVWQTHYILVSSVETAAYAASSSAGNAIGYTAGAKLANVAFTSLLPSSADFFLSHTRSAIALYFR
jgi:hypothetical protein